MLSGGFGTLIFFGIGSRRATNNITTKRIVTKQDVWEHRQTYAYGPSWSTLPRATNTIVTGTTSHPTAWEDTYTCSSKYYDSNGDFCGSSQSTGTDKKLDTTYYDANGHYCGTSVSHADRYQWNTAYYNSDRNLCGTSTSGGTSSTYYWTDGSVWDTSQSDSAGNTTYATPQQKAEREESEHQRVIEQKRAERDAQERQRAIERERRPAEEARIRQSPDVYDIERYYKSVGGSSGHNNIFYDEFSGRINDPRTKNDIISTLRDRAYWNPCGASYKTLAYFGWSNDALETRFIGKYYLSQAGFFNAHSRVFGVFKENDRSTVINELKNRAKDNPSGASEKTLKHFKLK